MKEKAKASKASAGGNRRSGEKHHGKASGIKISVSNQ